MCLKNVTKVPSNITRVEGYKVVGIYRDGRFRTFWSNVNEVYYEIGKTYDADSGNHIIHPYTLESYPHLPAFHCYRDSGDAIDVCNILRNNLNAFRNEMDIFGFAILKVVLKKNLKIGTEDTWIGSGQGYCGKVMEIKGVFYNGY